MFEIIVGFCLLAVILFIYYNDKQMKKTKIENDEQDNNLRKLLQDDHFEAVHFLIGADRNTGISIDDVSKNIALISKNQNDLQYKIIPYTEIIESKIIEDGSTITHTQKKVSLGKAVLGGIIAGGAGAIIGGTSGKSKTTSLERVEQLDLALTINNTRSPLHVIKLIATPILKNSLVYRNQKDVALKWDSLISVIMKQME